MTWPTDDPGFPGLPALRAVVKPDPELAARVHAAALRAFDGAQRQNAAGAAPLPWLLLAVAPFAALQLCLAFVAAIRVFTDS